MRMVLLKLSQWKWRLVVIYLVVLAASYLVRWANNAAPIVPQGLSFVSVSSIKNDAPVTGNIRIAYRDYQTNIENAAVVVLLHGSPGSETDFAKLAPLLAEHYRVIVPDLPGFGSSTQAIPDYSNRAHARYI